MKKLLNWLETSFDLSAIKIALGHDVREFALLWLVFSLLDPLIGGWLSARWIATNVLLCVALWVGGSYIEWKRTVKEETK